MVEALIRLVGCTSLFDNCLLSMRISGFCGKGKTRSMGLRQGCPLSATLFGLFIDGLHHCLEAMAPAAGVQVKHMRLRELVYADDICMIASSPEQLHALIDAFKLVFLLCYHAHGDRRPKDKSDGCLSGACTSYGVLMQWQCCQAGCHIQILGPPLPPVRCCCAFDRPNQVWWLLGCCAAAAFITAMW